MAIWGHRGDRARGPRGEDLCSHLLQTQARVPEGCWSSLGAELQFALEHLDPTEQGGWQVSTRVARPSVHGNTAVGTGISPSCLE